MKKSELRKLIREVISEQAPYGTTYCEPGPNCVEPELNASSIGGNVPGGYINVLLLRCPQGFRFQHTQTSMLSYYPQGDVLTKISYCIPDIGNPGDENMAGHGSTDNPFVPGMGFEDQFIDQITGPGGPFGGGKDGGKGKPIRESKKRRK